MSNFDLLDCFLDEDVEVTPYTIEYTQDDSGTTLETEIEGEAALGVFFDTATLPSYYTRTWVQNIDSVFLTSDASGFVKDGFATCLGRKYTVEAINDPTRNNASGFDNVYEVLLNAKE